MEMTTTVTMRTKKNTVTVTKVPVVQLIPLLSLSSELSLLSPTVVTETYILVVSFIQAQWALSLHVDKSDFVEQKLDLLGHLQDQIS